MKRFQPDPSRYEIEQNRGEGLSATVCQAIRVDPRENVRQVVALKFPKDGTRIADLRHEFEALSRVRSKHCARALAWESAGNQNVLVLEWIEGPTLYELACSQRLPTELQSEILAQIYQGLLDLHAKGLHHGDLHPNNVMVGCDGIVRLIDFASRGTSLGETDQFGVPAFLAPELRTRSQSTSFATDLFALGVLERGLRQGFSSLPDHASPDERGFCAREPLLRQETASTETSVSYQTELSSLITEFQTRKRLARTQILSAHAQSTEIAPRQAKALAFAPKFALSMVNLVLFSVLSVSVQAEAPLVQPVSNAKLVVTTLQWADLSLNGKKVGYSPVELTKLTPGLHRLSWTSAFGAGSLTLELKSGEMKRIDERALRAQSRP